MLNVNFFVAGSVLHITVVEGMTKGDVLYIIVVEEMTKRHIIYNYNDDSWAWCSKKPAFFWLKKDISRLIKLELPTPSFSAE